MKTQNVIIAHPETAEEESALRAFMQALKIKFETSKEGSYNPEFTEKVLESRKQARDGKVIRVSKEKLKEFLAI